MRENMFKPKITPLIFVLLFSLPFQIAGQSQQKTASGGNPTISGRFVSKGEPARGVTVILQAQNQNASNAPRARTDESGRFDFTGLPAGRYSVSALAPGYASPEDTSLDPLGKTLNI